MNGPLKILLLGRDADVFALDGQAANDTRERHIGYVRKLQAKRPGSEVCIIAHTRRPDGPRHDEPISGMRIFGTYSRSRLHCPIDMARMIRTLQRSGWTPDVISCQTGYEEGPIGLAMRGERTRVQIQMHSDYYGRAFASGSPLRRLQQYMIRRSIRRSDHVRAVSHEIMESIVRSGDITEDRVSVAPVPVTFRPDTRAPRPEAPTVLFVGRLAPEKDLDLWCNTARIIQAAVPAAQFVIAGDGPERTKLERLALEFGGALHLCGAVPYSDLASLYAKATVFLLTSHYEGLVRVVVEAMLAGVPVVSTSNGGSRALIEERVTGRLIDSREPADLAAAVVELLGDRVLAQEMAREAQSRAEARFGLDSVTSRLVETWEEAAALPRRSS